MSEIEKLTDEERAIVQRVAGGENDNVLMSVADAVDTLLRIHDAQTKRIAELESGTEAMSREIDQRIQVQMERLELVRKQAKRIVELEALVLSADTVSKAEYAAMVAQRDTMREDLKAARHMLDDSLGWLQTHDEASCIDELSQLIRAIEALPPFRA